MDQLMLKNFRSTFHLCLNGITLQPSIHHFQTVVHNLFAFKSTYHSKSKENTKKVLKICHDHGMPKSPPTSVYQLFIAQQMKIKGTKLTELAVRWKTQVNEDEKRALKVQLDRMNNDFKLSLHLWAELNGLNTDESYEQLAWTYCTAHQLIPATVVNSIGTQSLDHTTSQNRNKVARRNQTKRQMPIYKG